MPRRPHIQRPRIWRIERIYGSRAEYVGVVTARDAAMAVKRARLKYGAAGEELVARELSSWPARSQRGPGAEHSMAGDDNRENSNDKLRRAEDDGSPQ